MTLPSIIHFCWFGETPQSPLVERCLASWSRYAPEFRIMEWTERTCDMDCCAFVKKAVESKRWAFVSDYFRVKALAEYGGVYLVTDMELKAPLSPWCHGRFCAAFELPHIIHAGFLCALPNEPLMQDLKQWYETRQVDNDGRIAFIPIPKLLTERIRKYYPSVKLNGLEQYSEDGAVLYPANRFTIDISDGCCIAEHHYESSWKAKNGYGDEYRTKVCETFKILSLSQSKSSLLRNAPVDAIVECYPLQTLCTALLKHRAKRWLPGNWYMRLKWLVKGKPLSNDV